MPSERKEDPPNLVNYDDVSKNYDLSRRAGKSNTQLLVELLNPLTNAAVLDVGCGTANYLLHLKDLLRLRVGLDVSAGMLAQAKAKDRNALLVRADAVFMPFADRAFDAAYCIQVLHHIHDRNAFLSEVYRILKPGGRFAIQSCSHEQLSTFCCYHYFPRALEIDRRRIPDFDEISDLLSTGGFRDITIHGCPIDDDFRDAPEDYLDKRIRDGSSTFSLLTSKEIEEGCKRIKRDINSGKAAEVAAEFRRKAEQIGSRVSFIRSIRP